MVIRLDPYDLGLVRKLVAEWAPGIPVYVYGSRAHGRTVRPYSDLDLCLKGEAATPETTINVLRQAFDASALPIRVDVVDWHQLDIAFAARIVRDFIPL